MKAKHESQAFSKLTNELQTPPTKLYSPFNIYTDSCTKTAPESAKKGQQATTRSKRKLNLILQRTKRLERRPTVDLDSSIEPDRSLDSQMTSETPKCRIALRHKKHLTQAQQFTFDSPTGRFKETVKDVEHLQQCIEKISQAIRLRDQSS